MWTSRTISSAYDLLHPPLVFVNSVYVEFNLNEKNEIIRNLPAHARAYYVFPFLRLFVRPPLLRNNHFNHRGEKKLPILRVHVMSGHIWRRFRKIVVFRIYSRRAPDYDVGFITICITVS